MARKKKASTEPEVPVYKEQETVTVSDELRNNAIRYGKEVNANRAIPSVIDGCKPVHRKIAHTMAEMGAYGNKKPKVLEIIGNVGKYHAHGDCLLGSTKIVTSKGQIMTIADAVDMYRRSELPVSVLAVTKQGELVQTQAHSFREATVTREATRLTFASGQIITATHDHQFMTANMQWVKAKSLEPGHQMFSARVMEDGFIQSVYGSKVNSGYEPSSAVSIPKLVKTAMLATKELAASGGSVSNELYDYHAYMQIENYGVNIPLSSDFGRGLLHLARHSVIDYVVSKETVTFDDDEVMYDFTVDNYHNMLVPNGRDGFLVVHNSSIEDALVTYSHVEKEGAPWRASAPIVAGQGNWGGRNKGETAAAARYIWGGMTEYGKALAGIAKSVTGVESELNPPLVDMEPNYDGSRQQPKLLPALWPMFVVNKTSGIGYGAATHTAPHNINEALNLAFHMVTNPNMRVATARKYMLGPDLPTPVDIYDDKGGIDEYFATGRGSFYMRGYWHEDPDPRDAKGTRIVIDSLPEDVTPEDAVTKIRAMIESKELHPDLKVLDMSNATHPIRIVITIPGNVNNASLRKNIVDTILSKNGIIQARYSVSMNGILDGRIQQVGVLDAINAWLDHRREIIRRRFAARLEALDKRIEILEGMSVVANRRDEVVKIISASDTRADARAALEKALKITPNQSEVVVSLPLSSLTKMDSKKFEFELDEKRDEKKYALSVLSEDSSEVNVVLKDEIKKTMKMFPAPRRCTMVDGDPTVKKPTTPMFEVPAKNGFLAYTDDGWMRWVQRSNIAVESGRSFISNIDQGNDKMSLYAFTSAGRQLSLPAGDTLPDKLTKAEAVFSGLELGERIVTIGLDQKMAGVVLIATGPGRPMVKHIIAETLEGVRHGKSKPVMKLMDGYEVSHVVPYADGEKVVAVSGGGKYVVVDPEAVNPQGRGTRGVRFMDDDGAGIVAAVAADQCSKIVFAGKNDVMSAIPFSKLSSKAITSKGSPLVRAAVTVTGARASRKPDTDEVVFYDTSLDEFVGKPVAELNSNMSAAPKALTVLKGVSGASFSIRTTT